jgi:hypothetical protein
MINYYHEGHSSIEEIEEFKKWFEGYLGDFKQEFDDKNGSVYINFNVPPEHPKRYTLNLPNGELGSFIARFQEYDKKKKE